MSEQPITEQQFQLRREMLSAKSQVSKLLARLEDSPDIEELVWLAREIAAWSHDEGLAKGQLLMMGESLRVLNPELFEELGV